MPTDPDDAAAPGAVTPPRAPQTSAPAPQPTFVMLDAEGDLCVDGVCAVPPHARTS